MLYIHSGLCWLFLRCSTSSAVCWVGVMPKRTGPGGLSQIQSTLPTVLHFAAVLLFFVSILLIKMLAKKIQFISSWAFVHSSLPSAKFSRGNKLSATAYSWVWSARVQLPIVKVKNQKTEQNQRKEEIVTHLLYSFCDWLLVSSFNFMRRGERRMNDDRCL